MDFGRDFGDNRKVISMGADVRRIPAILILIGAALFLVASARPLGQSSPRPAAAASIEEMERGLLEAINRERTSRNLPGLRASAAIARLARAHSAEMALGEALTHESRDGRTLSDRLSAAAIDFAASGENVGFSTDPSVETIHRTFMNSQGHRENCLNPEFNEIGIGIAPGPGAAWYITEDFVRGVARQAATDVRAVVLRALDGARARAGRPAVVRIDELERMAQAFAEAKAAGRQPPALPDFFGETLARFTTGPDPNEIASSLGSADLRRYGRAGIGVRFTRSAEFPGGGYLVCVLLVADNASPTPDDLERLLTVLEAVNAVRAQEGLPRLDLDHGLCREADLIIRRQQGESIGVPRPHGRYDYFTRTWHLDTVDRTLRKRLGEAGFRRIGVSTVPYFRAQNGRPNPVADGFAVTVILDR